MWIELKKEDKKTLTFGDLVPGDLFLYNGDLYIKINTFDSKLQHPNGREYYAIGLRYGYLQSFNNLDTPVARFTSKIELDPKDFTPFNCKTK